MPELPEVETVRRGLEQTILGKAIGEVRLARGDLRVPFPPRFAQVMEKKRIDGIGRRAKYLLFRLNGGITLIAHLGMSGRFSVLAERPDALGKHDHALFVFRDGSAMVYNDARRFGLMTIAETKELSVHPLLAHLGPEPWDAGFNAAYLRKALQKRSGPVKTVLMDQQLVVGVGNIYACEALFRAGIDPRRKACDAVASAGPLVNAIRQVLEEAIDSGGSSLRDFFNADGDAGYFQHDFNVYGRAEKPCRRCGAFIRRIVQAGRSSFFCENCQR